MFDEATLPIRARRPVRPAGFTARILLVLLALVGFGVASIGQALAQAEDGARYWLMERQRQENAQQKARTPIVQRPTHLIRRAAPVKGFARPATEVPEQAKAPADGTPATAPGAAPPAANPAPTPGEAQPPAEGAPSQPVDAALPPAATQPAGPAAIIPGAVAQPEPSTTLALPDKAVAKRSFTVLVIGDSMGQMLGQGLTEAFADRPDVTILRKARENTGLVRDDYFDWAKGARDLLAGADKIDMAVMMIGSNDNQPVRDGATSQDVVSPRWMQIYTQRVEAIDQIFRDKKIPLLWVGAPIMKSERLADTLLKANDIYRDAASRAHETYVDVWEAFADERGQYAVYGPDIDGQNTRIRAGDGVHFTRAGARKLAHFVETEIRRALDTSKPAVDPAIANLAPQLAPAEPIVPPPAPALEPAAAAAPVRAPTDLQALLPVPAAPVQPVIPVKPASGAVVPLTTPVVSPGGQLATITRTRSSGESALLVERTLTEGRPLDPRPGRADDFRWPPN